MCVYPEVATLSGYEASVAQFTELLVRLGSAEHQHADLATAEAMLQRDGVKVFRQVLEDWTRLRSEAEPVRAVLGSDSVERTHHRSAHREVESTFGTIHFARDRASARGVDGLAPVDAVLNLPDDRFTFAARERLVLEAIRGSFDEAAAVVRQTTGAAVVKRQTEEVVRAAAIDFEAFYSQAPPANDVKTMDKLLVLSADGKGIVMRSEGLREQTRRNAEASSHKLEKRLSKGEKGNRKRMATVAAVYDLALVPRTVDDVLVELDGQMRTPRPKAENKRVWASITRSSREIIAEMFAEAERRDPRHECIWVVLVDGNLAQIRQIRAEASRRGVRVSLVLNLIHAIEYLWDAAWDFFAEGEPVAGVWVTGHLRNLLEGKPKQVAASIRRAATNQQLQRRKNVDKAANYFHNHASMMQYDQSLSAGFPIATGVIEGACRHLVKDRMDITGARWGLEGAEAILRLRSLHASGDLQDYWAFHQRREFERNHLSRYANQEHGWLIQEAA